MLLPVDDLYYKYRDLASNSKTPDINFWGQNLTEKANWKPKSSTESVGNYSPKTEKKLI